LSWDRENLFEKRRDENPDSISPKEKYPASPPNPRSKTNNLAIVYFGFWIRSSGFMNRPPKRMVLEPHRVPLQRFH
jgi:hypothetical protein